MNYQTDDREGSTEGICGKYCAAQLKSFTQLVNNSGN